MPAKPPVDAAANRRARRHPDTQPVTPRWASVHEAAKYLAVNPRTIRDMCLDGRLTPYRGLGNRMLRVDLNEIDLALGGACEDITP